MDPFWVRGNQQPDVWESEVAGSAGGPSQPGGAHDPAAPPLGRAPLGRGPPLGRGQASAWCI